MDPILMPSKFTISDLTYTRNAGNIPTVKEEQFFADKNANKDVSGVLPLPEGVVDWSVGSFKGHSVFYTHSNHVLYIIAETSNVGCALFRYESENNDDVNFKVAFQKGVQIIDSSQRSYFMSTMQKLAGLSGLANASNETVNPMNLGSAPANAAPAAHSVGDGITTGIDHDAIAYAAKTKGYVTGYIFANAPSITMGTVTTKGTGNTEGEIKIHAKQSKPSRCLAVLMALPANCVCKGGVMADIDTIRAGDVDFAQNPNSDEMIYQYFPEQAAIAYIGALGSQLPEYAPFVNPAYNKHFSPEDILRNNPDVSYVRVVAVKNSGARAQRSGSDFNFRLRTTRKRSLLLTEKNHICLTALEHTPIQCDSEQRAFELNNIAFGHMTRKPKTGTYETTLAKLFDKCGSQIWKRQYEVNGEVIEGIGSAFFMYGDKDKLPNGEIVPKVQLTFKPWYATGANAPAALPEVEKIVLRKPGTAKDKDGKERPVFPTSRILMKDNPNHEMFAPYAAFKKFIISRNYLTEDQLFALTSRKASVSTFDYKLADSAQLSLDTLFKSKETLASVGTVIAENRARAILGKR